VIGLRVEWYESEELVTSGLWIQELVRIVGFRMPGHAF
jgi:hypothetical protein